MNYEKIDDPTYKFEFNRLEAGVFSDIMNIVLSGGNNVVLTPMEKDFAQNILDNFEEGEF